MAFAAWHICLKSSSSLRIQRITLPVGEGIFWSNHSCYFPMHVQSVPSNTSVILQICENGAPYRGSTLFVSSSVSNIAWHYHMSLGLTELHACTTSMRWGLKDSTYCSSSSSSLASMETRAIRRAESCVQGREASHNVYNQALFTVSPTAKWERLVHFILWPT